MISFKIFKIFQIQGNILIEKFILNLLLITNRFYLLNSSRDSVSRKPLCMPKTRKTKTGSHLWLTYQTQQVFLLSGCVKLMSWRVFKIFRWSVRNFGIYQKKNKRGEGVKNSPPHQVRIKWGHKWAQKRDVLLTCEKQAL